MPRMHVTRARGEAVRLETADGPIVVEVTRASGGEARLTIEAPAGVAIEWLTSTRTTSTTPEPIP